MDFHEPSDSLQFTLQTTRKKQFCPRAQVFPKTAHIRFLYQCDDYFFLFSDYVYLMWVVSNRTYNRSHSLVKFSEYLVLFPSRDGWLLDSTKINTPNAIRPKHFFAGIIFKTSTAYGLPNPTTWCYLLCLLLAMQ